MVVFIAFLKWLAKSRDEEITVDLQGIDEVVLRRLNREGFLFFARCVDNIVAEDHNAQLLGATEALAQWKTLGGEIKKQWEDLYFLAEAIAEG